MKKQLTLALVALVGVFTQSPKKMYAQNPLVKQWDYRFGGDTIEYLNSFQQTHDGGYILGGISYSDSTGDRTGHNWDSTKATPDYWIIKIDSLGNKEWDKRYGGTNYDKFFCLEQTFDRGYILGGWTISSISGDKTQDTIGSSDMWIVKIDSLGNKQWDKDFGGILDDYLYSLQQTSDGGYI